MLLGQDRDGITEVSLEKLTALSKDYHLKEIMIFNSDGFTECEFCFQGGDSYLASGFGIGYGGEGPHGLWKAMLAFLPGEISHDFWTTAIPSLDRNKNWRWTLKDGFKEF